jgi:hypothetical protein
MSAICMLLSESGPCPGLAGLWTTPSLLLLLLLLGMVAGQSAAEPPPCSLLGLCAGPPLGLCRSRLMVNL